MWDTLQFLAPPLLQQTVDRLFRIMRPQSYLLAFFHAEEKAPPRRCTPTASRDRGSCR